MSFEKTPEVVKLKMSKPEMTAFRNFEDHVLTCLGFSKDEKLMLFALLRFRNKFTGECYPKIETLNGLIGLSMKKCRAMLEHFHEIGLIELKNSAMYGSVDVKFKDSFSADLHAKNVFEARTKKKSEVDEGNNAKNPCGSESYAGKKEEGRLKTEDPRLKKEESILKCEDQRLKTEDESIKPKDESKMVSDLELGFDHDDLLIQELINSIKEPVFHR